MTDGEVSCLVDSATMHTVFRECIYFINFIPKNALLTTLSGPSNLTKGYSKTRIMLSNGTIFTIAEAFYSPRSERMLLSFKDITDNNYHDETHIENEVELMCITSCKYGQKRILEKIERIPSGLYSTTICPIECHYVAGPTTGTAHEITLWHDHLGYHGRIAMRRILKSSSRHPLTRSLGLIQGLHVKHVIWESLLLSLLMTRFVRILPFFYNGLRGTFVDRFTLLADHLDTLWFWLTFPHVGHTCDCCPQKTLHAPNYWLRLSSSGLNTLIIQSNLFNWIMLENSHLKLLMTIACRLGLKFIDAQNQ
ncbi:hypothetical protein ACFX1Z_041299 [Malus domestica]